MNIYEEIAALEKTNQPFVLATVVALSGSVPGKVGFKMIVKNDGATIGTVGGGAIEMEVKNEAIKRLKNDESGTKEYLLSDSKLTNSDNISVVPMKCSGKATIYYEVHRNKTNIFIFGGGHVGHALLYYLSPLDYHIILVDNRKDFVTTEKNPFAHEYNFSEYIDFVKNFLPPDDSYAVILTHSHKFDYDVLKTIYERKLPFKYIGVIASKSKAASMRENLKKELDRDLNITNLHSPIGLNIGGNTAEEIALSIVAEIQKIRYNGSV